MEESEDAIQLTVNVVGAVNRPLAVSYTTVDDTATGELMNYDCGLLVATVCLSSGNVDFQQRSEVITVSPAEIQVLISVKIFSDNILEGDEKLSVFIASTEAGVTVDPNVAEVTIVDSSIGTQS